MTKYVIAVLVFVAALAGFLLYVGDEARLMIKSTSNLSPLNFADIDIAWQKAIVILLLAIIGLLGLWTFLGWLWRLPSKLKSGAGVRRRNNALEAMEEALIAGAEGDKIRARKKAEKARGLIKSAALGQMISAQAAEASGDSEEAINQYRAMLSDERTLATGQRGLARQLLSSGDLSGAIEHAGQAYADDKQAQWAFDVLFQAQVADHRWAEAVETAKLGDQRKHIDKDISKRRRAVLMTAHASKLSANEPSDQATELAVSAATDVPKFAPAVALASRLLTQSDNPKKAASLIEKAWSHAPHPALALAFKDIYSDASERVREKKINQLIKANPDHRESVILKAEQALDSRDGVTAWSALSPLVQAGDPSARLCLLAAQAEAMLNNPTDAGVWTERAATAPSEADWSDLDPKGEAFNYTEQDWRRLVYSFGETGELIHPRFEAGAARLAVGSAKADDKKEDSKETDIDETDNETDPKPVIDEDDLAIRLDNLLADETGSKT